MRARNATTIDAGRGGFNASPAGATSRTLGSTTGNMASGRAMSTVANSHNLGVMNKPWKKNMPQSIFYLPRMEEMSFEDQLIYNQLKFNDKMFLKKPFMRQQKKVPSLSMYLGGDSNSQDKTSPRDANQ